MNRQAIADAISTVPDCVGYLERPNTFRPGDGWVQWGGAERWNGAGPFINTWRVLVGLPNVETAAESWIADHLQDLVNAISPVAFIDSVEPVNIAGSTPALQFTVRE